MSACFRSRPIPGPAGCISRSSRSSREHGVARPRRMQGRRADCARRAPGIRCRYRREPHAGVVGLSGELARARCRLTHRGSGVRGPLPIELLIRSIKTDDGISRAMIAKKNPVMMEAIARGREEGRQEVWRKADGNRCWRIWRKDCWRCCLEGASPWIRQTEHAFSASAIHSGSGAGLPEQRAARVSQRCLPNPEQRDPGANHHTMWF